MRLLLLSLLLATAMGANPSFANSITIDTDTSIQLTGSFEASGLSDVLTGVSTYMFSQFLPLGNPLLVLGRGNAIGSGDQLIFGTSGAGNGGNPQFFGNPGMAPQSFLSVEGSFSNNPSSTPVYFLLSELMDTGGPSGTFTGRFSFSTVAPVPLPAAVWLFISAIGGLFGLKRLKASG